MSWTPEDIRNLHRRAREHVDGRVAFEKHVGRRSEKPLTMEVDARLLLLVMDRLHEKESLTRV